jgi:hypothetical protein
MGLLQDVKDYQPTKTALAWTAAGACAATVAAGFMLGGWVTAGTAAQMADKARLAGEVEMAGRVCADNFRVSASALAQHEELLALSAIRQRQFVQGQPWAMVAGSTSLSREAADACARLIVQMSPEDLVAMAPEEA